MEIWENVKRQMKAFVRPREQGADYFSDGIADPLGGEEVFTAHRRGSMIKSNDGLLYYPLKAGYVRSKTSIVTPLGQPEPITTNNDTLVDIIPTVEVSDGISTYLGFKIITAYQNSGGAINFIVWDSGDTQIVKTAMNSGVGTVSRLEDILFEKEEAGSCLQCSWSAAAGVTQHVFVQSYQITPIADV